MRQRFDFLHNERMLIEKKAQQQVSTSSYILLLLMGIQIGAITRLTWWDTSWDVMEPVTYVITFGSSILCFIYYLTTRQEFTYPDFESREFAKKFHKVLKNYNGEFTIEEYNDLLRKLKIQ